MKFIKRPLKRAKKVKARVADSVAEKASELNPLNMKPEEPISLEDVPKITNESIAEHREEVLSGARKYIYPLQHSKHRIVAITSLIMVLFFVGFVVYCTLAFYKFYQYNTFLFRVSQVVPVPIARTGKTFVDYENYLFELRRYIHYYENQQKNLFGGQDQINAERPLALESVINNAYVKILAKQNGVSVSDKEVDQHIKIARDQNLLGSNDKVLADVLRSQWGWSIADFHRYTKDNMLAEKVEQKVDSQNSVRAQAALDQVKAGADFAAVAKQVSDDPADKDTGGDFGFSITRTNPNVPPEVISALFSLKAGQYSDVFLASRLDIKKPDTLQIVKVLTNDGTTITAQHIQINLTDISVYVNDLKKKQPVHTYVHF